MGGVLERNGPQDLVVHTSFATKSSTFFRAALKHDWKEAREKRIVLPDTAVADFEIYLQWLYTGHLVDLDKVVFIVAGATLVRLYILGDYLGDYLGDNCFSNTIIDKLIQYSSGKVTITGFECETVDLAWEKTTPDSPLRKLLAQLIVCSVGGCHISPPFFDVGRWSQDVSVQVFVQTSTHARVKVPILYQDRCAFHKHDEEYPKGSECQ